MVTWSNDILNFVFNPGVWCRPMYKTLAQRHVIQGFAMGSGLEKIAKNSKNTSKTH